MVFTQGSAGGERHRPVLTSQAKHTWRRQVAHGTETGGTWEKDGNGGDRGETPAKKNTPPRVGGGGGTPAATPPTLVLKTKRSTPQPQPFFSGLGCCSR